MKLSEEQRAKIRAKAKEIGDDPDELEREAEGLDDETDGASKPNGDSSPASRVNGGKGFYAYQLPFIRVNELRKSLALPEDAPDGEMFTGEWMQKHGGAQAPSKPVDDGGEA